MLYEPTSLALTTNPLGRALREAYGVDPVAVFANAGLEFGTPPTPQQRYPLTTIRRLWQAAIEATGDPAIGLTTGWHVRPTDLYAFGFAWLASSTLRGALERLCRFHRVLSTAVAVVTLEECGEQLALRTRFPDSSRAPPKEGLDAGMTALLSMCSLIADREVRPVKADLTCDSTVHPDAYAKHLQAPINFGCDVGTLYFDRSLIDAPLPGGTPDIARATDRIAERYLEALDPQRVASEVRRLLIRLLPSGQFDQDRVARQLNRSASTLHRQLGTENTSYREVLDSTRRGLAEEYLRDDKFSIAEVAYLLGFSDQSNFSRAFKRWTSRTPHEYRSG
jgi:AraC-like DNA-binding protein